MLLHFVVLILLHCNYFLYSLDTREWRLVKDRFKKNKTVQMSSKNRAVRGQHYAITAVEPTKFMGSVPRIPPLSMKDDIVYDPMHKHFHQRSPTSLHIRASPKRARFSPWPMPMQYIIKNNSLFVIDPSSFYVFVKLHYSDILDLNLRRFWRFVFNKEYSEEIYRLTDRSRLNYSTSNLGLRILEINIEKISTTYPTPSMNESYSFEVNNIPGVLQLQSAEVWGAIRGLETISQIVMENNSQLYFPNVKVVDRPRFPHRGLMIDTSRHFIQKHILLENLEAMVQNKLNVFHWHMTDDQSFPFASRRFPNITKFGAYHPTLVYTHRDIADIIEAARLRGIRVIPEFDAPGHSFSWGYGHIDLLTPCFDTNGRPNNYFGPMNPVNNLTFEVLQQLYEEIFVLFPDNTFHIGGDEVPTDCWLSNPQVHEYMKKSGMSMSSLLAGFSKRLQDLISVEAAKRQKTRKTEVNGADPLEMIVWQEAYDENRGLSKNTIVQIWKNDEHYIGQVTSSGYKALFSSCWYLDISMYGIDWDLFYNCLSKQKSHATDYDGRLIGGEVCMWTEYVDDQTITAKIWPRASAAAERLWSPASLDNFEEAGKRIEEQNCRMKRRGLPSGVLSGPSFCEDANDFYHAEGDFHKELISAKTLPDDVLSSKDVLFRISIKNTWSLFPAFIVVLLLVILAFQNVDCLRRGHHTDRHFKLPKRHVVFSSILILSVVLVINMVSLLLPRIAAVKAKR